MVGRAWGAALGVWLALGLARPVWSGGQAKSAKSPVPAPTESKSEHSAGPSGDDRDDVIITRRKDGTFKVIPGRLSRLFRLGPGPHRPRAGEARDEGAEPLRGPFVRKRPPLKAIVAGADLSGADLSSMDLSHLDLTGALLVGANLRGATLRSTVLTDADLSGADLSGATMPGAKLTRARLFQAIIGNAVGLDLTGATLHPFFEGGEAVGTIKLYDLPDTRYRPQQILSGANGELFLLEPGKVEYWVVTPTGSAAGIKVRLPGNKSDGAKRWMVRGPGSRVSFLEHGSVVAIQDRSFGAKAQATEFQWDTGYNGATSAVAVGPNALLAALPGLCLAYLLPDQVGKLIKTRTLTLRQMSLQNLTAPADGSILVGLDPKANRIVWFSNAWLTRTETDDHGGLPIYAMPLEGLGPARCLVPGSGGRFWFLLPEVNGIGAVRLENDVATPFTDLLPPDPASGKRGLHGLVQGPDGNMWFTQQSPPGIGRIDAHGDWRMWPLDPGMVPEDLTVGSGGRLYFHLAGRATVGSIQTGMPSPEPPSSPVGEASNPRLAKLAWAETKGEPSAETKWSPAIPAPPPPPPSASSSSSSSSPVPEPEPGRSRKRLEGMGFYFDYSLHGQHLDRMDHILERHGYNVNPENSQFNPELSTQAWIPGLVLEGLQRAVETGRVLRRYDPSGMTHTPCDMARPVGFYQKWSPEDESYHWQPTSWMDIVTRTWHMPDGSVRTVIWSVFPCSRDRF